VLDQVIVGTKASYYGGASRACHLDLIPYATSKKWTELSPHERSLLLDVAGDTLGLLLRDSPVSVLILNGMSVVNRFQHIAGSPLEAQQMPEWALQRHSKPDITGIELGRELLVLGFNHNLQGSYGVTAEVIRAIRDWIARATNQAIQ
jgi:hypothetical protein